MATARTSAHGRGRRARRRVRRALLAPVMIAAAWLMERRVRRAARRTR